jgi:DNA polymerase I
VLDAFKEVVLVDFEFEAGQGERQNPVCLCAWELRTRRRWRLWRDQLGPVPPYPTGADTLFVSYYAAAEIGCHLALRWPMPLRVLDLYAEFRNLTNGLETQSGPGLVGALVHFGLPIGIYDKENLRSLIMGGGPWDESERRLILDYCNEDVAALARLLPVMLPRIDLPRALIRGRYMTAAARMEFAGVPIDTGMLDRLRYHWAGIENTLIAAIDRDYGVFDGRSFSSERFSAWLNLNGLPWPRLGSGRLDLSDETFRQQARAHPVIAPLRELRSSLAELRLHDLAVGRDGRNRTILSAFRSRTGRNQPSNSNSCTVRACGFAALSSHRRTTALPMSIGPSRNLGSQPLYRATP